MEEVSSFVQAQPPHPHTVECRGGPETPNQDSFSMELQAGRVPCLVVLQSPGQDDLRQFLCRNPPVMAAVTSPASCRACSRAPSQGPWPAAAAALPCWGHSSSQGGLVGCRDGCQGPPMESLPRMLLGKHPPTPAQAWGDLSVWWLARNSGIPRGEVMWISSLHHG